jgi:glucose/arabinose dehydrogenase
MKRQIAVLAASLLIAGCDPGHPPPKSNFGPTPVLPAPQTSLIPTYHMADGTPWPANRTPTALPGFTVTRYAGDLKHPRWIYVLPNGDVLVAESSSEPEKPDGFMDYAANYLQRNSGTLGKSANRITLLRDVNGDGKPEMRTVFLTGLNQPFGMLLLNGYFYVGNTDGIVRYPYKDGDTHIGAPGQKILALPTGHHWTRNIVASEDGKKIYVSVGSDSNIAEKGMAVEKRRADILQMNLDGSGERIYTAGLRNPNGMAWEPQTHVLWTVVNERDMLGDDLVPDYLTRVRDGAFYGWPWSYWGRHVDDRVQPQNPAMVATAIAPDYALGAHAAALGLAFYTAGSFPAHYRGGAFIGEHGSWNRAQLTGYKIVYIPFANGMPSGLPEDFLTGFVVNERKAITNGRPVGVAVDRTGALLVADDVGNTVWRVAVK